VQIVLAVNSVTVIGRRLPLNLGFSVSALEKFPGFGRKKSQTSDLPVAIGGNLAKADSENAFTSGSYRPEPTLRTKKSRAAKCRGRVKTHE
jgi:hypothetical protein